MTLIKIEDIIDHLNSDMKSALEVAVKSILPDADFDLDELFREFRSAVGRRCNDWVRVPDHCVQQREQ